MLLETVFKIACKTYVDKLILDTSEDVNVEKFHLTGTYLSQVRVYSCLTIHCEIKLGALLQYILALTTRKKLRSSEPERSEWFAVAEQGIAPCLEDYEPSVQLYTTPHMSHPYSLYQVCLKKPNGTCRFCFSFVHLV